MHSISRTTSIAIASLFTAGVLSLASFAFADVRDDTLGRAEVVRSEVAREAALVRENAQELGSQTLSGALSRARYVPDEVVVKYWGSERFRVVRLPEGRDISEALASYLNDSTVEYAEPNYIAEAFFVPNDTYYRYQWHFDNDTYGGIGAEEAWDVTDGSGAVVAVVDTGIAYENYWFYAQAPDLSGTDFVSGYDFINNDSHPNDDNGHGTHVAGTVAQTTDNGSGVAGLAYGASLMPVKVLDRNGSGSYATVANGIYYAADNGADVINLSLGGSASSNTLRNAVRYAYEKGVVVIAAAGNNGAGQVSYPAAYDDYVIAVGATRYDETRAPYSNYGSSLDLVAPGGDLNVDQNGDGYGDGILQQTFSGRATSFGYYFYQGTSMAAPHVAGAAALVIVNGNASGPDAVREALESTADDLGASGRDNTYGWGLASASGALAYSSGGTPPPPPPDEEEEETPPPPPDVNESPVADAGANVTARDDDGDGAESVTLDGSGSNDSDGTIASYEWKEGSTVLGTSATLNTTFSVGTHTITLTVTDNEGASDSDDVVVTVLANAAPTADAGADVDAYAGDAVSFDGSGSNDPDGSVVSYHWNFGDGTNANTSNASHAYASAGNYTATLTVTDNGGKTDTDTRIVSVTERPAQTEVFSDSFENGEWNGLWSEGGWGNWFNSSARAADSSYSAAIGSFALNTTLTSVPIDLGGREKATVSFSWLMEAGATSRDYVALDVSFNSGASWSEYARIRGNMQSNVWHNESIEFNNINNLQIRFRAYLLRASGNAHVDAVSVVAE